MFRRASWCGLCHVPGDGVIARGMSLGWRFGVLLGLLVALTLAASSAFWLSALGRDSAALRESRFQFSLSSVRNSLEGQLQLGLLLQGLPGAQSLIDRRRAEERDILSIDVFDDTGRILFSTDRGGVAATLPQAWVAPCLNARQTSWHGQDDVGAVQCTALVNAFDKTAGGVVLRYRIADRSEVLSTLLRRWHAGIGLWLVLVLAAGAVGWFAYRRIEDRLDDERRALLEESDEPAGEQEGGARTVKRALGDRERELAAMDREVDRLDDLDLG